jgi:large subunit ribosomal protein L16
MMAPKYLKYRKMHRGRLKGKRLNNMTLEYGEYGLQALEPIWLSSCQIEAVRRTIFREIKKMGKLWVKVYPDKSVTARVEESRMGTGKGIVKYWVAAIRPGTILFEISGISNKIAINILKSAKYKLPIRSKIILKKADK